MAITVLVGFSAYWWHPKCERNTTCQLTAMADLGGVPVNQFFGKIGKINAPAPPNKREILDPALRWHKFNDISVVENISNTLWFYRTMSNATKTEGRYHFKEVTSQKRHNN